MTGAVVGGLANPSAGVRDRIFSIARAQDRGLGVVARVHELELYPLVTAYNKIFTLAEVHNRGQAQAAGMPEQGWGEVYGQYHSPSAGAHARDLAQAAGAHELGRGEDNGDPYCPLAGAHKRD